MWNKRIEFEPAHDLKAATGGLTATRKSLPSDGKKHGNGGPVASTVRLRDPDGFVEPNRQLFNPVRPNLPFCCCAILVMAISLHRTYHGVCVCLSVCLSVSVSGVCVCVSLVLFAAQALAQVEAGPPNGCWLGQHGQHMLPQRNPSGVPSLPLSACVCVCVCLSVCLCVCVSVCLYH